MRTVQEGPRCLLRSPILRQLPRSRPPIFISSPKRRAAATAWRDGWCRLRDSISTARGGGLGLPYLRLRWNDAEPLSLPNPPSSMKRILRRLNRFRFIWASVSSYCTRIWPRPRRSSAPFGAERSPSGPEMAFAIRVPQPLALDPALHRTGTRLGLPDLEPRSRHPGLHARQRKQESGEADAVYSPEQSLQRVSTQGNGR